MDNNKIDEGLQGNEKMCIRDSPSGVRRTGDQPSDQGIEGWGTDYYRYTGTCYGSSFCADDLPIGSG